ncbi:MAG: hypothetical protein ACRDR6_30150, partial [Pseudonocardiaceae bacterium]
MAAPGDSPAPDRRGARTARAPGGLSGLGSRIHPTAAATASGSGAAAPTWQATRLVCARRHTPHGHR